MRTIPPSRAISSFYFCFPIFCYVMRSGRSDVDLGFVDPDFPKLRASWMPSGAGGGSLSAYAMWLVNILSMSSRYLQVPTDIFRCPQISSNAYKHL